MNGRNDIWCLDQSRYIVLVFRIFRVVGEMGTFPISGLDPILTVNSFCRIDPRVCFLKHDQKSGKSDNNIVELCTTTSMATQLY